MMLQTSYFSESAQSTCAKIFYSANLDISYHSWKPKRKKAKQKDPRPINTLLPH